MSKGLIERSTIQEIADAIRAKKGTTNTMTPAQMATEIAGSRFRSSPELSCTG